MSVNLEDCWVGDGNPHKGRMFVDPEKPGNQICQSHKDRRSRPKKTKPELRRCIVVDPGNHSGPIEHFGDGDVCRSHRLEMIAEASFDSD